MTAAARHDDLTIETISDALFCIPADLARDEWARIGMAIKSELGDGGFSLFEAWSKSGRGYDAKDCADTWKSIKPGGGVNVGTLIYKAQQLGFVLNAERQTLDAAAVEARKREREAEQKAAEAETRRIQGHAAKLANETWNASAPAGDGHPYLQGKRVRAHGLGLGEWPLIGKDGEPFKRLPDALLIPIMDARNGKVISLQGILLDMDGSVQKRYLKNGRKRGGFHMIGTPPNAGEPLAFCEGYATGATVHELTGWPVIVTFDAPNLPVVAELMREQFAQATFMICADNDAWNVKADGTPYNPGLDYAKRAADATRGCMIAPRFADDATRPTDFNDLATLEGDEAARAQLLANPVTARGGAVTDAPGGGVPANDNVDYFSPLPFVGAKGKPLATIENMMDICDRLAVTVRYNMIAKNSEILIPGEEGLADNRAGAGLARIKSECAKFGMPTGDLGEWLLYLSDKNAYNPVAQFISERPWDGVKRFDALLATVETKPDFDRDLWAMLLRRWLISAVAAGSKPSGFWSKGVLVFQGAQSLGKTAWFRALVPDRLRELIKVDAAIDPNNKDSIISAVSHWLVEVGELDGTLRKADIARLKGFISNDMDLFRRPYARIEESFPRRTVFFASVNPDFFLADDTGNVRWWTIPVTAIDYAHGIDMQQLWAEVFTWFEGGERWWLDRGEEARLEAANGNHQQGSPVEELILSRYGDAGEWVRCIPMTATQVLLAIGFDKPTKDQMNTAATALRKLFGEPKKTRAGRFYMVPGEGGDSRDDERPF